MSINSFNKLDVSVEIKRAISALGYKEPTKVQSEVLPIALEKNDVIVKAETGSGKTAAFGIPLCEFVDWEENKPQALVLAPTRELALQIQEDITHFGRFKRIKAVAIFGKQPFHQQRLELKQKNHVVVATPGRLLDHIDKHTISLEKVKYLVIDEADEMLNKGFIDQVEEIIECLPRERVTMLFSATLPKVIVDLCNTYMTKPTFIEIESLKKPQDKIHHVCYHVDEARKERLLFDVLTVENPDNCIIFCNTQDAVESVYSALKKFRMACERIHGGLNQEQRLAAMKGFKAGRYRFLVATDVAARGIDVDKITHVINYDFPFESESYVHRTGRTGRAGQSGKAISFIIPKDQNNLYDQEERLGFEIEELTAPSLEEVQKLKSKFLDKQKSAPREKRDKAAGVNKDIMKLYFNGGKKKKLRAVDFVGTITKIEGVSAEDIGIITIQDICSYVEILNGKGQKVLRALKTTTIKGKQLKVHPAMEQ